MAEKTSLLAYNGTCKVEKGRPCGVDFIDNEDIPLWHLKRLGARFGETPIVFVDRQHGASKINSGEALSALWILFRLGVKNWVAI